VTGLQDWVEIMEAGPQDGLRNERTPLPTEVEKTRISTGVGLDAVAEAGRWIGEQLRIESPALLGRAGRFPSVAAT
jgi:hypothetical protein